MLSKIKKPINISLALIQAYYNFYQKCGFLALVQAMNIHMKYKLKSLLYAMYLAVTEKNNDLNLNSQLLFPNKKSFKVLYVDPLSQPQAQCNIDTIIKGYRKISRLKTFDYRSLACRYGQFQMNKILIKTATAFRPDLIHLGKSELIYGLTVKKIKQRIKTQVAHFYGDFRYQPLPWLMSIGRLADCTFFVDFQDPFLVKQYKSLGIKNIKFWRIGTDPEVFYPQQQKKIYNIVFMANNANFLPGHDLRRKLIEAIIEQNWQVHIFGEKWDYLARVANVHLHPFVVKEDFAKACSSAKITLGINAINTVYLGASWRRTLNSMACGAFHLTHYIPGLENIFENRKHLVWFHSITEAIQLIKYYLNHPREREKIAQLGRQEVITKHNIDIRITEILKQLSHQNYVSTNSRIIS